MAKLYFTPQWKYRNREDIHVFANGHVFDKAERRKALRSLIGLMRTDKENLKET